MQTSQLKSTLDALQKRVMQLEDIFDASYAVKKSKTKFELSMSPTCTSGGASNTLFSALKGKAPTAGEIWINPTFYKLKNSASRIQITKELEVLPKLGSSTLVVVCEAQIDDSPVVLKFRNVDKGDTKITEREGDNALMVTFDRNIEPLFPTLVCMFEISIKSASGADMKWSCIGFHKLAKITDQQRNDGTALKLCGQTLSHLHHYGYFHGNSRMENFMVNDDNLVVMIDQDDVRRLPTQNSDVEEYRAVSSYMQILDYLFLLFQDNPLCNVYQKEVPFELKEKVSDDLFAMQTKFHEVFTPFPFFRHMGKDFNTILQDLRISHHDEHGSYIEFLGALTSETIDKHFAELFESREAMQHINDQMRTSLVHVQPRKVTYKHTERAVAQRFKPSKTPIQSAPSKRVNNDFPKMQSMASGRPHRFNGH